MPFVTHLARSHADIGQSVLPHLQLLHVNIVFVACVVCYLFCIPYFSSVGEPACKQVGKVYAGKYDDFAAIVQPCAMDARNEDLPISVISMVRTCVLVYCILCVSVCTTV